MRSALIPLLLLVAAPLGAALSEQDLAHAQAHPPAGAHLPAALVMTDQDGRRRSLGAIAGGQPLVLIFADYTCAHVCGPGLTLTAAALGQTGLVPGRDYRLAVIGLDPKDTAADARAMGARLGPGPIGQATRLLRGDPVTIAAAEHYLGYGVAYDAETDQFAHDASVYVFARDGRLATVLPELGLAPGALKAALAGGGAPATFGARVARLCYGLGAGHGRYGNAVATTLRIGGVAMLVALGIGAVLLQRRRRAA